MHERVRVSQREGVRVLGRQSRGTTKRGLRTAETNSLPVWRPESEIKVHAPPPRGGSFLPLPASGGFWRLRASLGCGRVPPASASSPQGSSLSAFSPFLSLLRTPVIPELGYICRDTFPNEVTFTGSWGAGGLRHIFLGSLQTSWTKAPVGKVSVTRCDPPAGLRGGDRRNPVPWMRPDVEEAELPRAASGQGPHLPCSPQHPGRVQC